MKSSYAPAVLSTLLPLALWCVPHFVSAGTGIVTGNDAQLFIDDYVIERTDNLTRKIHRAEKYFANPVLTYTKPWEGHCVVAWGSVLYDDEEQVFKMWYEAYRQNAPPGEETYLLYATSRDGIYWNKPELNLVSFRGSSANNIVFHPSSPIDSAVVIRDKAEPKPERRYKMMYYLRSKDAHKRGLYGAVSSDGIHWNTLPGPMVSAGDRSGFFFNPLRRTFVFMSRPGKPSPVTGVVRWVGLWESHDFASFGPMHSVLWPDENDVPGTELYSLQPFMYESAALGYLEMFYTGENDRRKRRLNTQLAVSHDGLQWGRAVHRQTFLNYGPIGSWDGGWVCPTSNAPIRVGDRLYIYYQGRRTFHWGTQRRPFEQDGETYEINDPAFGHIGSIGLSILRVDGFASMKATGVPGTLTTKALLVTPASNLFVNADVEGSMRVSVLDSTGSRIDGYESTTRLSGDRLEHRIQWQNGKNLRDLVGKSIKLRFDLTNADLYSFRFVSTRQ